MRVNLSNHAYQRYRERVGPAYREVIEQGLQQAIDSRRYSTKRKRSLTCIDDIWWGTSWKRNEVVFETCYGLTDYDLPVGLAWAARQGDQIRLGVLYDA